MHKRFLYYSRVQTFDLSLNFFQRSISSYTDLMIGYCPSKLWLSIPSWPTHYFHISLLSFFCLQMRFRLKSIVNSRLSKSKDYWIIDQSAFELKLKKIAVVGPGWSSLLCQGWRASRFPQFKSLHSKYQYQSTKHLSHTGIKSFGIKTS